jgi:ATP-binding cassette subfamily B protein
MKDYDDFDQVIKGSYKGLLPRLLKYLIPYKKQLIIAFLIMLTSLVASLAPNYLQGTILRIASGTNTTEYKYTFVFIFIAVFLVMTLFVGMISYFQAIMMQKVGQNIVLTLREETFEHIQGLSDSQLNKVPIGTLVTRVTNNTEDLSEMYSYVFVDLIYNSLYLVVVLIVLFVLSWQITIYIFFVLVLTLVLTIFFKNQSREAYRNTKSKVSKLNAFLSENLSGMKITQIFNQQQKKIDEFNLKNKELNESYLKEILIYGFYRPLIYLLSVISYVVVFYIGIKLVRNQQMDAYAIFVYYQFLRSFFGPVEWLADQVNVLQGSFASSEKIFDILDTLPEVIDGEDSIELETFSGHIEFKNVWFSYIPNEWVLKDVSFEVKTNETVAFVGATGSGKTTILSLIARNYEVQKGEILLDGINIKNIKRSSLRKHIGQMLQDVFLFNETIKNNITLHDDSISDEEVVQACEYVGANDFIEALPDAYNHIVLERGNNFSSGQRQLLSFARTIVYKPSLMILDEATANIDSETEELIQKSLHKMMSVNTMLVVAHRLSTIQHSDRIIVMSKGEIIEVGSHQELLKRKGYYYNLYELQYESEHQNMKTKLKGVNV